MKSSELLTASDVLLEEADSLLERGDFAQASEKYYKAAEEAVKLLAKQLNLAEIIQKAKETNDWDLEILHKAVLKISEKLNNKEIFDYWESAIVLLTANLTDKLLIKKESENVKKLVAIADQIANT